MSEGLQRLVETGDGFGQRRAFGLAERQPQHLLGKHPLSPGEVDHKGVMLLGANCGVGRGRRAHHQQEEGQQDQPELAPQRTETDHAEASERTPAFQDHAARRLSFRLDCLRDGRTAQAASPTLTTSAAAVSPAAQPVNSPRPPPRSSSSSINSMTRRMPVGACGCPQISELP